MKYKVGDRVRVKTWEEMAEEFGFWKEGKIETYFLFTSGKEKEFIKLKQNRIVTIEWTNETYYRMVGFFAEAWGDDEIECSEKDYYKRFTPINDRWEILDL